MCPKCQNVMTTVDKDGIHIEQCGGCRGVFLDRGELEQIVNAENAYYGQPAAPPRYSPAQAPPASAPHTAPPHAAPPQPGSPPPTRHYGHGDSPRPYQGGYQDSPRPYGGHGGYRDSPRPYGGHGGYRDSPRPYGQRRKRGFLENLFD